MENNGPENGSDQQMLNDFAALSPAEQVRVMDVLPASALRELYRRWPWWAHGGQNPPPGNWRVWLIRAGRGFGKTRAGAEWVCEVARSVPDARIALVGANADDVRQVMIEGPSGVMRVAREDEPLVWRATNGEVTWPNGSKATVYSAETPERLRGPEHHAAWCDELAKWRLGDATWDNLVMTMRMGDFPRVVVTTTPRSTKLMRRVMGLKDTVETRGGTRDNPHLPDSFVAAMADTYEGTRLGRQELEGELIDDLAGALWTRAMLEACRAAVVPELLRVVVAVDPPAGVGHDACGIVVVALGADGLGYVIEDASVSGATPEGWARAVADCAARHDADRVVAEKNQGGEMVRSTLMAADAGLAVKLVHASRGKVARAEPVAALYEVGRVRHLGVFRALEDELCGLVSGGGYEGPGRSPDRADALVWGLTELMLLRRRGGSVRGL